ncbi:MAG: NAD(P)/FAD-dependent oxidoreductase [Bdellovibrionales bacterium]
MGRAELYDCIVIGAGPGGLVSAIYLQRFRRKVLLVDGGEARVQRVPRIRNLVGYPGGISGSTLLRRLHRQLRNYGGQTLKGRARVSQAGRTFDVDVDGRILRARKIILATGMKDLEPNLDNLRNLTQKGLVGYCPVCDAFDHRDQRIALLVSDNHGLKKLSFMSGYSDKLIAVLMKEFKISSARARDLQKRQVQIVQGPLLRVTEAPSGKGVQLHVPQGPAVSVDVAYVMMGTQVPRDAIGNLPRPRRCREGFLVVGAHQETSVPGLFAVGDCVGGLSQVSVAVGQAAIAATQVHNSLISARCGV